MIIEWFPCRRARGRSNGTQTAAPWDSQTRFRLVSSADLPNTPNAVLPWASVLFVRTTYGLAHTFENSVLRSSAMARAVYVAALCAAMSAVCGSAAGFAAPPTRGQIELLILAAVLAMLADLLKTAPGRLPAAMRILKKSRCKTLGTK